MAAVTGAVLGGAVAAGTVLGDLRVPLSEVWAVAAGHGEALPQRVVLQLRVPRLAVAVLAGSALAVSGILLQGITRNPLHRDNRCTATG